MDSALYKYWAEKCDYLDEFSSKLQEENDALKEEIAKLKEQLNAQS